VLDALSSASDGGIAVTEAEAARAVAEIEEAIDRLREMKRTVVEAARLRVGV
jgi:hypothetical protein